MKALRLQPLVPESPVNMSPEAVMARLVMVGQLNELCRFLATGKIVPPERLADSAKDTLVTPNMH